MTIRKYHTLVRPFVQCLLLALILSACAGARQRANQPTLPVETARAGTAAAPVSRNNLYWQIQTITWGSQSNIFSALISDERGRPSLAYVERNLNRLNLAVLTDKVWTFTETAGGTENAEYPSLTLGGENLARIGFYDAEESAIMYGQNTGGKWQLKKAVENVLVTALTLLISPEGQPVILFADKDLEQLRYAVKSGGGWEVRDIAHGRAISWLPALYGPDGRLHLVSRDAEKGLLYLSLLENGSWETQVIDPAATKSRYPALAFGADGRAHASYDDPDQKGLRYAVLDNGRWQVSTVDSSPGTGNFSSLVVGPDHIVHISYYDGKKRAVKYAAGGPGQWEIRTLDDQRELDANTSITLDAKGNPHILYSDGKTKVLRVISMSRLNAAENRQKLAADHRSGQTFLTWMERVDLQNEIYRIYRSDKAVKNLADLSRAQLLAQTGERSSRFYASYHDEGDRVTWRPRYTENLIPADGELPVPDNVGLLVWTVSQDDFKGSDSGSGYYAVTVTPEGGKETFSPDYQTGPVEERVQDPQPVEISQTPSINADPKRHIYIQYMDLRRWNATFHAPNQTNRYYGFPPDTPGFSENLQYAYDYTIFEPGVEECGGSVPGTLPVYVFLHGYRGNRYGETTENTFQYCAYGILPIDETETWYFGFAQKHDFRQGGEIEAGDTIENYTEQRVLRMVYDLLRNPPGPQADEKRVYVFGHSMGGSGALAFAERYPNVFAGAYSGQPITNYLTAGKTDKDWAADVAMKWGRPDLNLPVWISAPDNWAEPLQKYNGTGVWDWQNYTARVSQQFADDMVPLGMDHGVPDDVIIFQTQGKTFYPELASSGQAWGGLVNDGHHEWSNFAGQMPAMGNSGDILPFWNFSMIRDETVPGMSRAAPNPLVVEGKGTYYNHSVMWSSSWNPWDGKPVDQPDRWQMSFCAGKPGSPQCETGVSLMVDITPRRTAQFRPLPGRPYIWQNQDIASGKILANGTVIASQDGLVTVESFHVSPNGSRLIIQAASANEPAAFGRRQREVDQRIRCRSPNSCQR